MFLELKHTRLDTYQIVKQLVGECYKTVLNLPSFENYNLVQQIRRAAVSVHLNYSEGSSRSSAAERKRYYEIARGSLVEIDAALDLCEMTGYIRKENLNELGSFMQRSFRLLSELINSCK